MTRTGLLLALSLYSFGCAEAPAAASLRAERDRAVRAGVRWLDSFLADPQVSLPLGVDAVGIFAGYAASAEDEESRQVALSAGRRQAQRIEPYFLEADRIPPAVIPDLLYLLVEMRELELDTAALAARAAREIAALPSPNSVYCEASLDPDDLVQIPAERFMGLVLSVCAVERAAVHGYDFGIEFGLEELLPVMRNRPLREGDRDDLDNVTHMGYLLNEYGRLRRTEDDLPEAFAYMEHAFPEYLAAQDIDFVGEIVDVWRNLGRDETSSEAVRNGTVFLLEAQNPDGSWGQIDTSGPYLRMHPTWCAIMALGERRFQSGTPYERRLDDALRTLPREPAPAQAGAGRPTGT